MHTSLWRMETKGGQDIAIRRRFWRMVVIIAKGGGGSQCMLLVDMRESGYKTSGCSASSQLTLSVTALSNQLSLPSGRAKRALRC
jgi:hypothetical protein